MSFGFNITDYAFTQARTQASNAGLGIFSVKDFGAKGDGVANDTAAIQAALNQASIKGGVCFVPPGGYILSRGADGLPQALNLPSNVHLVGVGIYSSFGVFPGSNLDWVIGNGSYNQVNPATNKYANTRAITLGGNPYNVYDIGNNSPISMNNSIRNISIQGEDPQASGLGYGIMLNGTVDVQVVDCLIFDFNECVSVWDSSNMQIINVSGSVRDINQFTICIHRGCYNYKILNSRTRGIGVRAEVFSGNTITPYFGAIDNCNVEFNGSPSAYDFGGPAVLSYLGDTADSSFSPVFNIYTRYGSVPYGLTTDAVAGLGVMSVNGEAGALTLTSADSSVTIVSAGSNIDLHVASGGGSVTSVGGTSPISSSGGTTPNISLTGIVPVLNGGTGTSTPSLVAGSNITVTGSFPNQTVAATGGIPRIPPLDIFPTSPSAYDDEFTGSSLNAAWTTILNGGGTRTLAFAPGGYGVLGMVDTAGTTSLHTWLIMKNAPVGTGSYTIDAACRLEGVSATFLGMNIALMTPASGYLIGVNCNATPAGIMIPWAQTMDTTGTTTGDEWTTSGISPVGISGGVKIRFRANVVNTGSITTLTFELTPGDVLFGRTQHSFSLSATANKMGIGFFAYENAAQPGGSVACSWDYFRVSNMVGVV